MCAGLLNPPMNHHFYPRQPPVACAGVDQMMLPVPLAARPVSHRPDRRPALASPPRRTRGRRPAPAPSWSGSQTAFAGRVANQAKTSCRVHGLRVNPAREAGGAGDGSVGTRGVHAERERSREVLDGPMGTDRSMVMAWLVRRGATGASRCGRLPSQPRPEPRLRAGARHSPRQGESGGNLGEGWTNVQVRAAMGPTDQMSKYSSNSCGCGRRRIGSTSFLRFHSIQVAMRSGVNTSPSVR